MPSKTSRLSSFSSARVLMLLALTVGVACNSSTDAPVDAGPDATTEAGVDATGETDGEGDASAGCVIPDGGGICPLGYSCLTTPYCETDCNLDGGWGSVTLCIDAGPDAAAH
jgi:hypothetical protein